MKETCWKPFAFLAVEHLAAQDFLNAMAAMGWELERIAWGYFAKFRRSQRKDLTYFLDWSDPEKEENEDYLRLCADAGWELALQQRYWNIYASRPGTAPSPIQTDPELEYQRFRKKVLRRMVLTCGFVLLGLLLAFLFVWPSVTFVPFSPLRWLRNWEEVLSEDLLTTVLLFLVPFWGLCAVTYCVMLARRLLHWKRRGHPFHSKGISGSVLNLAIGFSLLLLLVTFVMDILYNGVGNLLSIFIFLSGIFNYLQSREAPKKRKPDAIIVFLLILLSCTVLHFPAQKVLPHRIPEPFSSRLYLSFGALEQTDTLLGSYSDWLAYYNGSNPTSDTYSCSVYSWATPSLAEYFVQGWSDQKVPIPGYENVWKTGNFVVLFRGSSYVLLYDHDTEDLPIDEALAWLESWA